LQAGRIWFAGGIIGCFLSNIFCQIFLVIVVHRRQGWKVLLRDMLVVIILLKPALDAYRVASGNTTAAGALVEPLKELVIGKAFMSVSHSIPGATIQLIGLIGSASWGPLVSIGCACMATAFFSASITFDYDTHPKHRREYPGFYGFIPSGPKTRMLIFCVMALASSAHLLQRVLCFALLAQIDMRWPATHMCCDVLVYLLYKAVSGDFLVWGPGCGVPLSIFFRIMHKLFLDFSGCIFLRNPTECGGAYFCFSSITNHVVTFASVALYAQYCPGGDTKLPSEMLYAIVASLFALWALSFGTFLLAIERRYIYSFVSIQTGAKYIKDLFLDNDSDDAKRAAIFSYNDRKWNAIRDEVHQWVDLRYKGWVKEKPEWYVFPPTFGCTSTLCVHTCMCICHANAQVHRGADCKNTRRNDSKGRDCSFERYVTSRPSTNCDGSGRAAPHFRRDSSGIGSCRRGCDRDARTPI
jgi:hypothetical protein